MVNKVLYIISSKKIGGGEMHLLHLLSEMKKDPDFEASVFCIGGGELEYRLKRMNIPLQTFEMENLWSIGDIWRLGKAMKKLEPSLVHCHLNRAALYGTLFAKFLKIPAIATAHGLTKSIYYKFADYVICVSEAVNKHLSPDLGSKTPVLRTIHNGIPLHISCDKARVNTIRKELMLSTEDKLLTVIGTFHKNKGQDIAIRALNEIPESKNVKLLLTGAGEEEKHLKDLANFLSLAGKVHFLPPQPELGNIYKASDFILVPSHKEALSLVTLEALLHEIPVIASETGGIPEIITTGKEGTLVPPGDHKALAAAIISGIDNYRNCTAMAKDGAKKVKDSFSLDLCYKKTRALYEESLK